MSADKYPSTFSRQMEATVYILPILNSLLQSLYKNCNKELLADSVVLYVMNDASFY